LRGEDKNLKFTIMKSAEKNLFENEQKNSEEKLKESQEAEQENSKLEAAQTPENKLLVEEKKKEQEAAPTEIKKSIEVSKDVNGKEMAIETTTEVSKDGKETVVDEREAERKTTGFAAQVRAREAAAKNHPSNHCI